MGEGGAGGGGVGREWGGEVSTIAAKLDTKQNIVLSANMSMYYFISYIKPVEVTVMTKSRGSWEGEGSWGRRGGCSE